MVVHQNSETHTHTRVTKYSMHTCISLLTLALSHLQHHSLPCQPPIDIMTADDDIFADDACSSVSIISSPSCSASSSSITSSSQVSTLSQSSQAHQAWQAAQVERRKRGQLSSCERLVLASQQPPLPTTSFSQPAPLKRKSVTDAATSQPPTQRQALSQPCVMSKSYASSSSRQTVFPSWSAGATTSQSPALAATTSTYKRLPPKQCTISSYSHRPNGIGLNTASHMSEDDIFAADEPTAIAPLHSMANGIQVTQVNAHQHMNHGTSTALTSEHGSTPSIGTTPSNADRQGGHTVNQQTHHDSAQHSHRRTQPHTPASVATPITARSATFSPRSPAQAAASQPDTTNASHQHQSHITHSADASISNTSLSGGSSATVQFVATSNFALFDQPSPTMSPAHRPATQFIVTSPAARVQSSQSSTSTSTIQSPQRSNSPLQLSPVTTVELDPRVVELVSVHLWMQLDQDFDIVANTSNNCFIFIDIHD